MSERCETCRFFRYGRDIKLSNWHDGFCRRYPSRHPVKFRDYCGEHQARPEREGTLDDAVAAEQLGRLQEEYWMLRETAEGIGLSLDDVSRLPDRAGYPASEPAKPKEREFGYYWVRAGTVWQVAYWTGDDWQLHTNCGEPLVSQDAYWVEIDERRIERQP